jgi:hypothetical protein
MVAQPGAGAGVAKMTMGDCHTGKARRGDWLSVIAEQLAIAAVAIPLGLDDQTVRAAPLA